MKKNKLLLITVLFLLIFLVQSVFALPCDSGDLSGTCTLSSTYTFTDGEVITGNELIITSTGRIQNTVNMQSVVLDFNTIIIESGGFIRGGNVTIIAENLNVEDGSYISSNNLGFPTAQGPGYLTHYAGSYGGLSGALSNHNYIYGSSLEPSDFGSGGLDGPGSGHIRIISENFNLEGYISSSTTSGSNRRGSGGSIYVTTDYLSGTGYFIATSSGAELGGGGGRIAVYYNESTFTGIGQSSVAGGLGNSLSNRGQAGTMIFVDIPNNNVIMKDGFRFQGMIRNANETQTSNKPFWNSSNPNYWSFNNLTIWNNTWIYARDLDLTVNIYGNNGFLNLSNSFIFNIENQNLLTFTGIHTINLFNNSYLRSGNVSLILTNLTIDKTSYISSNNLGFPTAQGPGYLTHYAGS
ncbi:MAG: hypothetical protein ACMXYG_06270, partial [Candidatus Woesearchaeota archaeon]